MLLNEASALSAADRALTSAAAAAQPKAGFQVALGTIDPPIGAMPLANAELMKSAGFFGRVSEADAGSTVVKLFENQFPEHPVFRQAIF
jgi:hypothetical protein